MFQSFLKKPDIFGCLYFGAGFDCSNFGFCNFGFDFFSLGSFRARFGFGISACTIFAFLFNGALTSSISFCRSRFNFSSFSFASSLRFNCSKTDLIFHSGEGRIQNVDESMCYMFNSAKRSWTV